MAKVSILTFHHANNYGAVLQSYGLFKAIHEMGHDVNVIDYRPLTARLHYGGHWPHQPLELFKTAMFRLGFYRFRHKYLSLSPTYLTFDDMSKLSLDMDYVICGSDQVWNIKSYRGFDPAFFLNFIKEQRPQRISYAASFGNTEDLGDHGTYIKELLMSFSHISVRDHGSKMLVENLIGRPVEHVLDPCFMTDFVDITPSPIIKHPYILFYCFSYCGNMDYIMHVSNELKRHFGIPVIYIGANVAGCKSLLPSPIQWLSLMRYAAFVCTNSFHGLCFSLINRKQFIVLRNNGKMSRLEDLLNLTGLTDRLVFDTSTLSAALRAHIDYRVVSRQIETARHCSFNFLHKSLD